MRKLVLLISLAAAAAPAFPAPPQPRDTLLEALKEQLTSIRASDRAVNPVISRPDPSSLIGARRSDISDALGTPDFCRGGPSRECADAAKWDFFYFKHPPKVVDHGDNVEIQLATGGWSLVLDFDSSNRISQAAWVRQE